MLEKYDMTCIIEKNLDKLDDLLHHKYQILKEHIEKDEVLYKDLSGKLKELLDEELKKRTFEEFKD